MHLNILLSLTLFALVIQANCSQSSKVINELNQVVNQAADKVRKAIESNPNAYRPLTEKSLVIPLATGQPGAKLALSNGVADGLSTLQGANGNELTYEPINEMAMSVNLKFDNLSFTFDFVSDNSFETFPDAGVLQFIAKDIQFPCSIEVRLSNEFPQLVFSELYIPNEMGVGTMELLLDNVSYEEYYFEPELNFEAVFAQYTQKMSDYAGETLSQYSNVLRDEIEKQILYDARYKELQEALSPYFANNEPKACIV